MVRFLLPLDDWLPPQLRLTLIFRFSCPSLSRKLDWDLQARRQAYYVLTGLNATLSESFSPCLPEGLGLFT